MAVFEVKKFLHIRPIPKDAKHLLVKCKLIKLPSTVFYHIGEWVCSFRGCDCSCGICDNSPESIRPHTQECNHTLNSHRTKDCGTRYEKMVWSCCDGNIDDEREAIHGCQIGKQMHMNTCPGHRIFSGDQRLRYNAEGRLLNKKRSRWREMGVSEY